MTRLVADAVSDAHIAGLDHDWALDLPEEPVVVVGDEARLQVLVNLLANARIHTLAGTAVTTSLSQEGGTAVLTVADDGPASPICCRRSSRGSRGATRRGRGAREPRRRAAAPASALPSSPQWSRRTTGRSRSEASPAERNSSSASPSPPKVHSRRTGRTNHLHSRLIEDRWSDCRSHRPAHADDGATEPDDLRRQRLTVGEEPGGARRPAGDHGGAVPVEPVSQRVGQRLLLGGRAGGRGELDGDVVRLQ